MRRGSWLPAVATWELRLAWRCANEVIAGHG